MADDMFRAPVNRGMRILDRSKFIKSVPLKAARIFDNKNISKIRAQLERSKGSLQQERIASVQSDPDPERAKAGKKCILLRPDVATVDGPSSAAAGHTTDAQKNSNGARLQTSTIFSALLDQNLISIIPYILSLDYNYWTYHDIISAILLEDEQGEIPSGFQQVGHVAHLNLRDDYLKHKHLIAQILMDKNPSVRTVINKLDDVGEESVYRTFSYEVLAGPDDMNVTISEENCTFKFDYSKVYWNSRLNTEHRRLVNLFQPGDAVCDVMAGIGPFAVPAAKKGVFVWANDLNPESYACLKDAVVRNKVAEYVRPFNEDGRTFIRTAVARLAETEQTVDVLGKVAKKDPPGTKRPVLRTFTRPKTFSHFILNLPASAITFLPSFIGLYAQPALRHLFPLGSSTRLHQMPLIHVYCFSTKSDDNVAEGIKVCEEITVQLGYEMKPGDAEQEGGVEVHDVRDVAPKKRMFCATFRLPREVAFREV